MFDNSHSFLRIALGLHNPNHAAALVCALLPLGWGWRGRLGRVLSGGLFAMLLLTQSRTGLLVAGLEVGAWWCVSRRGAAHPECAPYHCGCAGGCGGDGPVTGTDGECAAGA